MPDVSIRSAALLSHLAALVVVGLLLVSAGQPIFTDDVWWHLGLGEIYAAQGPWLDLDPFLHTAQGPPAPAAWLFDLLLYGMESTAGLQGLRVIHVALVIGILGLTWLLARRAAVSAAGASLCVASFTALAAHRLIQLRPHLLTILAALLVYWLLVADGKRPSWGRVCLFVLLMALWANLHAAFLLGLLLPAAAVVGLLGASLFRAAAERASDLRRARRLAVALGVGALATLVNPGGLETHLLYWSGGEQAPVLSRVLDEWSPVDPFSLPSANAPVTPLAWGFVWFLLAATACAAASALWRWPRRAAGRGAPDPALLAMSFASLAMLLAAVRFLWLGIFPLLAFSQWLAAAPPASHAQRVGRGWAIAGVALLLVPGFLYWGDWPRISRVLSWPRYFEPYLAAKYHGHAVWLMRDAQLEGRLYNDYFIGNYLSYALAPDLRVFVSGSLNVPEATLRDSSALARGVGRDDESFFEVLDRYGIDVFLGVGMPRLSSTGRSGEHTTTLLEGADGWIPIFRNVQGAVYLRVGEENRGNLRRITDYYAGIGLHFDPERGFDVEGVIREAPEWAVAHGVIPAEFGRLEENLFSSRPAIRREARARLASVFAVIGLYERAVALDRKAVAEGPNALAARRLVWSLLHLGRETEALTLARDFAPRIHPADVLSAHVLETARRLAETPPDEELARSLVAALPLFTVAETRFLLQGFVEPKTRERHR